jgi:ribonuclease-3
VTDTDLEAFQKRIGYRFQKPALLRQALTHKTANRRTNYESMEYVGDAFMLTAIREWLTRYVPHVPTRLKVEGAAKSNEMLGLIVRRLGIPDLLAMSKEEACGDLYKQSKKYADAYEALITAIYMDGGYEAARNFVWRTMPLQKLANGDWERIPRNPRWKDATKDLVTLLQQLGCGEPTYTYVHSVGKYQVWQVDTCIGQAWGRGQKGLDKDLGAEHAKGNAASKLLRKLLIDQLADIFDQPDTPTEPQA